jgi:predicted amidophosphoribosyltransferase
VKDFVTECRGKVYNQKTTCPSCGNQMQVKHLAYKHRCGSSRKKEPKDFEQRALRAQQRAQELFKKRMET